MSRKIDDLAVHIDFFTGLTQKIRQIRQEVFVEEQGFVNEFDDEDERARQALVFVEGEPAATGRILAGPRNKNYTVGRIAVRKKFRGQGLGEAVMQALEEEILKLGGKKIVLSAQVRAKGFYEKLGYREKGQVYMDESCPHIHMEKILTKIIFFDIDGTLRDFGSGMVPESAFRGIEYARRQGVKVAVATGRHFKVMEQEHLTGGIVFDAYVTLNGNLCLDGSGRVLYGNPLKRETVEKMVHLVEKEGYCCTFLEEEEVYINRLDEAQRKVQEEIKTLLPPIMPVSRALSHPIYQMIPCMDREAEARIKPFFQECEFTHWSEAAAFDVIPVGTSKVTGIEKVLEHFGLQRSQAAAFGDGYNDVSMLSYVQTGISMGNGVDPLKEAADYITSPIDSDGLEQGIHWLLN